MTDYRDPAVRDEPNTVYVDRPVYVERKRRGGSLLGAILLLAIVIVVVLFATGFWTANVTPGSLPSVSVQSKEIVVGTKQQTVNVPTIGVEDKPSAPAN
ncbi:hypothetical protein [Novosphingobium sp.]|uniref:hypothetical protein n=1 Tax=Novosphingobium sp. TaxID=1874826 RepID=UPI003B52CC6C